MRFMVPIHSVGQYIFSELLIQAPCNVPFYAMEDRQREILSF